MSMRHENMAKFTDSTDGSSHSLAGVFHRFFPAD